MKIYAPVIFLLFLYCSCLAAQDTIRIGRHDRYDRNCSLIICSGNTCSADSVSLKLFSGEKKPEVRVNKECTVKKKFDVFVSSFELVTKKEEKILGSHSSFFTEPQKKLIQQLKPGESFTLKNIVIHAPDGFRKMDELHIVLK